MKITDNNFSRQFETKVSGHLARIQYTAHERKVFLSKLEIPEEITEEHFKENFIAAVLDHLREKNLKVMPTNADVKRFLIQNSQYMEMLPVGIRLPKRVVETSEVS